MTDKQKPPASNRGVSFSTPLEVPLSPSSIKHVDAGVDWLSATTKKDHVGHDWYDVFISAREKTRENNWPLKPWSRWGYAGQETPHLKWGYSSLNGYILIAAGGVADKVWRTIVPTASKVTRMDLRVDCHLSEQWCNVARAHYDSALASKRNRQRTYSTIQNSRGGDTLYVGSRQSQHFGRCYDSGAKNGTKPGYIWRYEVQINKPKASPLASQLYEKFQLSGPDAWEDVVGYVYQWFDGRCVTPIFRSRPTTLRKTTEYSVTTAERKLAWLRRQCAPTIHELVKTGLQQDVVDALGFTQVTI